MPDEPKAVYQPREESEHYYGVPARDLTQEEYVALPDDLARLVDHGVLYEVRGKKRTPDQPPAEPDQPAPVLVPQEG